MDYNVYAYKQKAQKSVVKVIFAHYNKYCEVNYFHIIYSKVHLDVVGIFGKFKKAEVDNYQPAHH